MGRLYGYKTRLMVVGFVAVIVVGGGSANADFTFDTPTKPGPPHNSAFSEWIYSFSADGLEMYLGSENRPGGYGKGDMWVAKRETVNDPWREPVNLGPTVNSPYQDWPRISPDGLTLYIESNRPGGYGAHDIWVATRESKDDDWGTPVNLGPPVNSPAHELWPSISADGLELYFSGWSPELARPGGYGWSDIWVSTRPTKDAPWGEPTNLGPLVNSPSQDSGPYLSLDGLVLFFHSQRDGRPPYGELYMTRRATRSDPWGLPVNLGAIVNTPNFEENIVVWPDGSTLFFSRLIASTNIIEYWQAPIITIIDLNGDGIVDAADMCIMVDHWGENYSLCDIGPMPWGDSIVDVQDLVVLAEQLFEEVNDPTLIAHWSLDETQGVIAYDGVADYDGILNGGPVWQPDGGMVAGALQFDGIDDYVSIDPVLNPADGKFSVITWIKGGGPSQAVLSQADGVDWLCTDSVEGNLMTEFKNSGRSSVGPMRSQANITDGNWHRVGFVWDGSYRYLYVDGAEVARDVASLTDLESADGGLYFGVGSALAPGTFFSGLIDDIRIYNRALHP